MRPLKELRPLPMSFYARPTEAVASELLGKLIVRRVLGEPDRVARLIEVEAYLGERDAASHARRGPTPRSAIMFGPPGHLYVYLIYGMYHCMNVVCEKQGVAGAVLLRAAEPILGFDAAPPRALAGPGKLCAGLGITRADNGTRLKPDDGSLYLATDNATPPLIATSPRVGVDYAGEWAQAPLRFFVPGHALVSGRRKPLRG